MTAMTQIRTRSARHTRGRRIVLPDGGVLAVRPVEPEDRDELAQAYRTLSPESRRLRFIVPPNELTGDMLRYLTAVDGVNHAALVALDADLPGQPGVAIARYVRIPEEPECAEIAVTVVDDHQRRGIGTRLLEMMIELAVHNGLRRVRGYVAADNRILEVARSLDAEITTDTPGVVRVDIPLPRSVWVVRRAFLVMQQPQPAAAR
jgi:RimJ/RimL family protein N-acetyltransferase